MSIRSSAKAIIINKNSVLLNKCFDEHNGEYYSLPGGGQHTSETLEDAIKREVFEETGYSVKIKRFSALFEEICEDPRLKELYPDYVHKIYHIFLCELEHETKNNATEVDTMQISSEWINLEDLDKITLMPKILNDNILRMIKDEVPIFLGTETIMYSHG